MASFPMLLSVVITSVSHICSADKACFGDNVEKSIVDSSQFIRVCENCTQTTAIKRKKRIKLDLDFSDYGECMYVINPQADANLTIFGDESYIKLAQHSVTIGRVSVENSNLPVTIELQGRAKLSVKRGGDEGVCLTLESDKPFSISCLNETETMMTKSGEAQTTDKVSVIAGSGGAFVLTLSIVVLTVVCRRRARQRSSKSEGATEASVSEFTGGNPYAYTTVNPAYQTVDSK